MILGNDDRKLTMIERTYDEISVDSLFETIMSIEDKEKAEETLRKLGEYELLGIYQMINGTQEDEISENDGNKYKAFGLPDNMSIGIEIEAEGENSRLLPECIGDWLIDDECTLGKTGIECTSPKLYDTSFDIAEVYKVTSGLQRLGLRATEKCGGHIHIGADYIESEEGFRELLELWGNAEEVYFLISNKPGELPREDVTKYAEPISKYLEGAELEDGPRDEFVEDAKEYLRNSRDRSLNLMNVNNGKNTIEFRLSNGTVDGNTWVENVRLYGRTVQIAQSLGKIVEKLEAGEELTEEEKRRYALKEMLKSHKSLDEKMDILMQILFSEEERKVYYERYNTNKKLDRKEYRVARLSFGKVDFKKVYDGVEIPEGIISQMQEEEMQETEQR